MAKLGLTFCLADGCNKKTRTNSSQYCEAHYMRMYRNGSLEKKKKPKPYNHTGGYVLVPAAGHPMALGSSHAYEHRVVYYEKYGEGPFLCYWCRDCITWENLHIDHIDDNKKNNSLSNLVASCSFCNQKRGKWKAANTWAKKTGIEAFGKIKTISEWSREYGISRTSIKERIQRGMSPEEAISAPRGKFGPKTNRTSATTAREIGT